jgi:hypothetical protein
MRWAIGELLTSGSRKKNIGATGPHARDLLVDVDSAEP